MRVRAPGRDPGPSPYPCPSRSPIESVSEPENESEPALQLPVESAWASQSVVQPAVAVSCDDPSLPSLFPRTEQIAQVAETAELASFESYESEVVSESSGRTMARAMRASTWAVLRVMTTSATCGVGLPLPAAATGETAHTVGASGTSRPNAGAGGDRLFLS